MKKRAKFKKVLALLLAVAMVFTANTPVFADDVPAPAETTAAPIQEESTETPTATETEAATAPEENTDDSILLSDTDENQVMTTSGDDTSAGDVVEIGTADAFKQCIQTGGKYKLIQSIAISGWTLNEIKTEKQNVELDLNQQTLSFTGSDYWQIKEESNVKVTNGTISSSTTTGHGVQVSGNSSLVLENVAVSSNKESGNPLILSSGMLELSGSTSVTKSIKVGESSPTTINVKDSAEAAEIVVSLNPAPNTCNVNISGGTVKKISAGTANKDTVFNLNVSAGTVEDVDLTCHANGNDTPRATTVNITGGTIKEITSLGAVQEGSSVAGGTFESEAAKAAVNGILSEGKVFDENGTVVTETPKNYVAQIGETKYETLAAAIEAASNRATITLLQDTTESVVIPKDKSLYLDLNGKTLTGTEKDHAVCVSNFGAFRVLGGEGSAIVASAEGKQAIYNCGTVAFMNGCTASISRKEGTDGYVIYNDSTAIAMMINQKVTIKSSSKNSSCVYNMGVLSLSNGAVIDGAYIAVENGKKGELEVNDTVINGGNQAISNWNTAAIKEGTMNGAVATWAYSDNTGDYAGDTAITGGTINGLKDGSVLACWYTGNNAAKKIPRVIITGGTINGTMHKRSTVDGVVTIPEKNDDISGSIAVSGGVFDGEVPAEFCAEGFRPKDNGDGTYTVEEVIPVASIGEKKYMSLADAISAVQDGDTVNLLADVKDTGALRIDSSITLAGNGHTISGNSSIHANKDRDITINKVKFSHITNEKKNLSAIYGSGLARKLSITNCEFDNIDWDAIQITPVTGAEINITGNTFSDDKEDGIVQQRYIHIEAANPYNASKIKAVVTDNILLGQKLGNELAGIYFFTADSDVQFSGNYIANMNGVCITSGSYNKDEVNKNDLIFPARSQKDVDKDDLNMAAEVVKNVYESAFYATLQEAVDAAKSGQTIKLLSDVMLDDNTPIKIVDKGTVENPITFDLNGHVIEGSNDKAGVKETDATPGGILWIYGSYAELTDNSSDTKGGIINTYQGNKLAYGLVSGSTTNNAGAVTISGGVKIEVTGSTSTSARAIYFRDAVLTIENANVICNKGYALYVYGGKATINGGEFTSTGKANNAAPLFPAHAITINGGRFHNWGSSSWEMVSKNHIICVAESADSKFIVNVTDQAPDNHVASVDATGVYPAIYLIEGNLYMLHNIQPLAGSTIYVKKNVNYIFPTGQYYGDKTSSDPGIYNLTLDLAEGVTLSGGMALNTADVTVKGAGNLASDFTWTPNEGFEMTADGEANGLYSCRMKTEAAAATVTKADGTTISYSTIGGALAGAKANIGSTLKMYTDAEASLSVTLNNQNGVVADFTWDLNGHTYTYTGASDGIILKGGAKLTLTDSSTEKSGALITKGARNNFIANSAIVTAGPGCTIIVDEGATVKNLILLDAPDSKLTVAGTVDTTGFSTYAICGNGSKDKGNTEIVIKDTAKIISDSSVAAPAIYHPQSGTLTIEGGTITGYGGVQMCSGDLIISGNPTITATGTGKEKEENAGGIPDGAAISVVNRNYPGGCAFGNNQR